MKITDALLGEHGAIYALLGHAARRLEDLERLEEVQGLAGLVEDVLVSHARLEDELLFPELEQHVGPVGPLAVMRYEHTAIEDGLAAVAATSERAEAVDRLRETLQLTHAHFAKEEHVLFPLAQRALGEDRLAELGTRWALARRVEIGPEDA